MEKGTKLKEKLLKGGGVAKMGRWALVSQLSSWTDIGVRMLFFSIIFAHVDDFYRSNLSVFLGAFAGGVVNCTFNYSFTFRASNQSIKALVVKYFLVWLGSMLLNMYGTTFVAMGLSHWTWLHEQGFTVNGIFAGATLAVALAVSLGWNYVLQRGFVYKPSWFDPYAIRFVDWFVPKKKDNTPKEEKNI